MRTQITFLETIHEYFILHNLRHDPAMHKLGVQHSLEGRPVEIKVFHSGELEE